VHATEGVDLTSMSGYNKTQQYVYGKLIATHLTDVEGAPATLWSDGLDCTHVRVVSTLTDQPTPQMPKPQDQINFQVIQALHSLHSSRNTRVRPRG
jgi:hypothetical protein